jgi:hypothetical protein
MHARTSHAYTHSAHARTSHARAARCVSPYIYHLPRPGQPVTSELTRPAGRPAWGAACARPSRSLLVAGLASSSIPHSYHRPAVPEGHLLWLATSSDNAWMDSHGLHAGLRTHGAYVSISLHAERRCPIPCW